LLGLSKVMILFPGSQDYQQVTSIINELLLLLFHIID